MSIEKTETSAVFTVTNEVDWSVHVCINVHGRGTLPHVEITENPKGRFNDHYLVPQRPPYYVLMLVTAVIVIVILSHHVALAISRNLYLLLTYSMYYFRWGCPFDFDFDFDFDFT